MSFCSHKIFTAKLISIEIKYLKQSSAEDVNKPSLLSYRGDAEGGRTEHVEMGAKVLIKVKVSNFYLPSMCLLHGRKKTGG